MVDIESLELRYSEAQENDQFADLYERVAVWSVLAHDMLIVLRQQAEQEESNG